MSQETAYKLFVKQKVEGTLNNLVSQVQELVKQTGIHKKEMEKHQLSNLLGVALETSSVAVITNYILYQIGRDDKRKSWRSGDQSVQESFGERLVTALNALKESAETIVADCRDRGFTVPADATEQVWMELVRQYIGQLNRYFYYRKSLVETQSKTGGEK